MANSTLLTKAPPAPRSLPSHAQQEWNAIARILTAHGCTTSREPHHTVWAVVSSSDHFLRVFSLGWSKDHGWNFRAVPLHGDSFSRVLVALVNEAIATFGGVK